MTKLTLAAARKLAKQHASFLPHAPTPEDVASVEELIRLAIEAGAREVSVGYPHGAPHQNVRNRVGHATNARLDTERAWLSRLATIFTARGFTCKVKIRKFRRCEISGWTEEA